MKPASREKPAVVTQRQVTEFYENAVFPSRTSNEAYQGLVPENLGQIIIGDFGCGQSLFINKFRKLKYNVLFLDVSRNALNLINYGNKIQASLTDIPIADDYIDVILCIGVVHHIPEMERAISELVRVLKKGGVLYLGVYSHRSLQALVRRLYEYTESTFLKRVIHSGAELLIWVKNGRNGLRYGSADHRNRLSDLLKTPLVRYLPMPYYTKMLRRLGCRVIGVTRISSMNVLITEK